MVRFELSALPGGAEVPADGDPAGQMNGYLFWEPDDAVVAADEWGLVTLKGLALGREERRVRIHR